MKEKKKKLSSLVCLERTPQEHTFIRTPPFHTFAHLSSFHSSVKDKRRGTEHQQRWCSADPSAVGLTHVAGQTERVGESQNIERRRGQVVLSNPPPG